MFQRIQQYAIQRAAGRWYRPRAYGNPRADGRWDGWLIFFPLDGGEAIAPPHPETTQTTSVALATWAAGLTPIYIEGALERALTVASEPAVLISQLADAEYEALLDAERLEEAAEFERASAGLDEVAATAARDEADRIRRRRLAAESAAATEEAATKFDAEAHEQAAEEARETVAAARRGSLDTPAASVGDRKPVSKSKKR